MWFRNFDHPKILIDHPPCWVLCQYHSRPKLFWCWPRPSYTRRKVFYSRCHRRPPRYFIVPRVHCPRSPSGGRVAQSALRVNRHILLVSLPCFKVGNLWISNRILLLSVPSLRFGIPDATREWHWRRFSFLALVDSKSLCPSYVVQAMAALLNQIHGSVHNLWKSFQTFSQRTDGQSLVVLSAAKV